MEEPLCPRCKHGTKYERPPGHFCENKKNFGEEYRCEEFEER